LDNSLIEQSYFAPDFIRNIWPGLLKNAEATLQPWVNEVDQIYLCGCGDSYHAAVGLEFAFDLWSGREVRAAPAMFMSRYLIPRLSSSSEKTLVIGISASGEVSRTLEAINLANEVGAKTFAFTSNPESSLAKLAMACLAIPIPSFPGPGLVSYLSSLLMGYSTSAILATAEAREEICVCMDELPSVLDAWLPSCLEMGKDFAEDYQIEAGCLFVAGGSLFGSALFAAAKVIESAGTYAWAQELEEWAHIEYFCNPAQMPTCFLTAGGRTSSREEEVFQAAKIIGRQIKISHWEGRENWRSSVREALAPLGLWASSAALAARLAERLDEEPFRNFGGGRSQMEGGGASRIRSSMRFTSSQEFVD
jgi:glucosamine--fructose-6-phosphate aminotransferase (isomerizing)